MTGCELLRRLLVHTVLAATVLYILLVLAEVFVPGSVLPFLNLIDGSVVLGGMLSVAAWVWGKGERGDASESASRDAEGA